MSCKYYIKIGGENHTLFESSSDVTSLAEFKSAFKRYLREKNISDIGNLVDKLKSFSNFTKVELDDINENSVGVFTPADLISNLDPSKLNIYNVLQIHSKDQNNIIVGFGDETVPTKFYKGHIFLNLNYIDNKSNNLIALTELALSENLDPKEYESLDFSKLVNTPGNEAKINEYLDKILVGNKEKVETLKSQILTAYYKSQVITETGTRNYNTERNSLEEVWKKYDTRPSERGKIYTPDIDIRVEDLKQGDYVLVPNPERLSSKEARDYHELFYDYHIDMDNNYIIRTIRYNSKDGKPFLVSWPASKYVASPKGTTIQQHSIKVQAKIYSPEVYKDYNYSNDTKYVDVPVKFGRTNMKYEWISSLLKKPSTKVIYNSVSNGKMKLVSSEIKEFSGENVKLKNGDNISINNIKFLSIEAPSLLENQKFQTNYKTPSVGENIKVKHDDVEVIGQVVGYDYIKDAVTYVYLNEEGKYRTATVNTKSILATAVPQGTNENLISTVDAEKINKYVEHKLNGAISVEQSITNNLNKHGLNLEGLTFNVEQVNQFTSVKTGDILYDPTLSSGSKIFKVLENVNRNIKGEIKFFVKTITSDSNGNLVYINIPREALGKYLLFTNRLNTTFANLGVQKNRYELFSNNDNDSPEYTPVKVYRNPNGFIFTLPAHLDPKNSEKLYEKPTKDSKGTVEITKEYAEELQKRYKWETVPDILYARHQKVDDLPTRNYKKDTLNTVYVKFNNQNFVQLIDYNRLSSIVPGTFITFKGDTDAYVVEKAFNNSLLISKYAYTKTGNGPSGDLEYVKCEKFYLTKDTPLEIVGLHVPKWAKWTYDIVHKVTEGVKPEYGYKDTKKSIDNVFTEADNKEILVTLSQHLENKFGVKINLIHNSELGQFNDPELYKAKAFVNRDEIYVNIDKASLAEPLHEVLHLVLATLKAKNSSTYYSLVRSVQNHPMFETVAKDYNEINTELLEETFIKLFSSTFRKNVLRTGIYNEAVFDKAIKDTISDLLDLKENLDWEDSFDLMEKPIKDILTEFGSGLISEGSSLIDKSSVYMMFDISNAIRTLLHDGNLEQKCSK